MHRIQRPSLPSQFLPTVRASHRITRTTFLLAAIAWIGLGGIGRAADTAEPPAKPPEKPAVKLDGPALAAEVKAIFRSRCFDCHGGTKVSGDLKILDHKLLVADKKDVTPGKPDDSTLFTYITSNSDPMPPEGRPKLRPEEIETVRNWIAAGAPAYPTDLTPPAEKDVDPAFKEMVGVDYVYKQIHAHVRTLSVADRKYVRYFSTNHLLSAGASREELDVQYDALCKAINHLSWEPRLVRPKVIDPAVGTVFAIDLRELGWQKQPYQYVRGNSLAGRAYYNLFDLALLEYPYAAIYQDSETFDHLIEEFLIPSEMVRPVIYVRADWFVCTATLPPLYEDFLQLPFELYDLEHQILGVDSEANVRDLRAKRAGMSCSGVSRNNRVVEHHPGRVGGYWKSFDYKTSKGTDNMMLDPFDLHPTGGEMIFGLPNGLQGYFVALGNGRRIEAAPTEIVTDKNADDKTVRNGLSCIRCHDLGMKPCTDNVRAAVEKLPGSVGFDKRTLLYLYPEKTEMDAYLKEDGDRFMAAIKSMLGKDKKKDPLTPVSQQFLENPLQLSNASAELGLPNSAGLTSLFRTPQFTGLGLLPLAAGGLVRRDTWEDYYDQVVRSLGLGIPVIPIDAVTRPDLQGNPDAANIVLSTNRKNNVFGPGDDLVITIKNKSTKVMYVELIGTGTKGEKVMLITPQALAAGESVKFPKKGALKFQPSVGKEQLTVYASEHDFPTAEILRGPNMFDRAVHPFYSPRDILGHGSKYDPGRIVKKTIELETK